MNEYPQLASDEVMMKPMKYVPTDATKKVNLAKSFKAVGTLLTALGWEPAMVSDYDLHLQMNHGDNSIELFVVKNAENVVYITSAKPTEKASDEDKRNGFVTKDGMKPKSVKTKLTDIAPDVKHVVVIQINSEVSGFFPLHTDYLRTLKQPELYIYSELVGGIKDNSPESVRTLLAGQFDSLQLPAPEDQSPQPSPECSQEEHKTVPPSQS